VERPDPVRGEFLVDLAAGESWRPDGGASLTTYWLRGVAGAVYRRAGAWANERQRRLHELSRTGTITQLALAGTTDLALGPERMARVDVLREVLPPAGDHSVKAKQTRAIAVGYLSGKTRGEIATQLRINPSRVDYLLRTLRAHALSRVTLGVIDPTVIPGFVDRVRAHADAEVVKPVEASGSDF